MGRAVRQKPVGERKPAKQQIPTLNRIGCAACPLDKAKVHTPKMQPTLVENTIVYFLAEAPGADEDEVSHRPLTGPSGKLLRECIPSELNGKCSFDNCVRDRPEGNRTPTWVEIECCRSYVTASIEKAKPKLIVGLGAVTLQWMLKTVDLQGLRGRFFAVKVGNHSCYFLPTYHPSFVLRIAFNKKKPLNSKMGHCFRMDIERACNKAPLLETPKIDLESEVRGNVYIFDGKQIRKRGGVT